ncbi:MAG: MBL fold metallo-hydrolase [Chloroflexi bacterium]|nr:MBL fold metallo-hydrolase [Chloroflexota bacterium]
MEKISEHVYVHQDSRHTNLGLIQTPQGTVLVDTPMLPDDARQWRDEVMRVSSQPPRYLINTDHHIGHALGNWAFPNVPTITHRNAAFFMLEKYDATWRSRLVESFRGAQPDLIGELETMSLPRPSLGVVDELTLHDEEFAVEVIHGGGHTQGTLMVRVTDDDILFTGDLVVQGSHPNLGDANSAQWLQALDHIRKLNPRFIVPGHGELATAETLDDITRYVTLLTTTVENYYRAGLSRKDVVSKIKSLEGYPIDNEDRGRAEQRLKASVQRVYDEFKEHDRELEKARS